MEARNAELYQQYAQASQALEAVIAQRDEAERAKAVAIATLHAQNQTLVWRIGGVFRKFGRRFPRVASYVETGVRLLSATVQGRRAAFLEQRKRSQALLDEDRATILSTLLFEEAWYLEAYPDVAGSEHAPIDHYLRFGAVEGRRPNPYFDPAWYLASYEDARESRHDPLAHYISVGAPQNYRPCANFDPAWYAHRHRTSLKPGQSVLEHFRQHGGGDALAAEPADVVLKGLS